MKNYLENIKEDFPFIFKGTFEETNITEIRLRVGKRPFFIHRDRRYANGEPIDKTMFDAIILRLCGGNIYKHEATLLNGYFNDIYGGRCGVACTLNCFSDSTCIETIDSINIRIPVFDKYMAVNLYNKYRLKEFKRGTVIIGLPGCGKTTYLKSFASLMSEDGVCVTVIDQRREFPHTIFSDKANVDILKGYNKIKGIEVALRALAPELLICDELGAEDRNVLLYDLSASSVPLVASAHSIDCNTLLRNSWFKDALDCGVFSNYVHLTIDCNCNINEEIGTF